MKINIFIVLVLLSFTSTASFFIGKKIGADKQAEVEMASREKRAPILMQGDYPVTIEGIRAKKKAEEEQKAKESK